VGIKRRIYKMWNKRMDFFKRGKKKKFIKGGYVSPSSVKKQSIETYLLSPE